MRRTVAAMSPLGIWFLLMRPKYWVHVVVPVSLAVFYTYPLVGFRVVVTVIYMSAALSALTLITFINDYCDYINGVDQKDPRAHQRPLVCGAVSLCAMKRAITITATLLAVFAGWLIYFEGVPVLIVGMVALVLGVLYTAGPYPLGYHGMGEVLVFITFGPLALMLPMYVLAGQVSVGAIVVGLGLGFLSVGGYVIDSTRDHLSDRASGKWTLVAKYGKQWGVWELLVFLFLAGLCLMYAFDGQAAKWSFIGFYAVGMGVIFAFFVVSGPNAVKAYIRLQGYFLWMYFLCGLWVAVAR